MTYNAIGADMAAARSAALMFPQPEFANARIGQLKSEMMLEAGVTAASFVPTAAAISSTIGLGNTMSAIGGVGRMGMGLVRGGMGMVGGAARYAAAAALANPLGALAVGGTIAGTAVLAAGTAGVVATGERALGDLRAGHEMQNILTVRGSSVEAARDISRQLLQTGRTAGNFTGVETEAMFEMGLQGGLFSRQMGDPQQLVGRLGKVARSAKELMRTLNLGMREAMQQIVEMNQMGVEVEDVTATTMQGSAFARAAGVSQGAMSRAGAMGARMATSMGNASCGRC
jgi:hypothetical protein